MPEDDPRSGRRRPPWWFMPIVMTGLGLAAAALAMTMMTIVE
ncbi:hypothetical protein [Sphingobium olei]|uniref:Uncharacterized protein n=1 Tax=Sphingobium olei TaxID=420955 RepID=A0ABW3P736_9SPHN